MTLQEIMTSDVITVRPDESIEEAIRLITKNKVSGMPVVDGENRLVGIISEKDILKRLFPDYTEFMSDVIGGMHYDFAAEKRKEIKELKVKHLMKENVITTAPHISIMKACAIMIINRIRRIPLIEEGSQKLVGIVSQSDIFHALLKKTIL